MGVKFTNNAETTLSSGINNSVTTISVASSSTFPSISGSNYFYATIDDDTNNEVVKVTAVSGTTWTVVRAQDNTTARAFDSGDKVELRMNVALLEDALGDAATFARDSFTGDGSTTDFTLSQTAASENNLIVFIEGVFQTQSAYSLSGTTLSFSSAPANTREIIVYSTQALSAGTVTTASIVDDNITQAKIADDAVGADQLAASAVVTASIVDDNVTQAKIADDAVGADQLASSAVVTASIVDDAVTTAKIADDQVTLAKMAGLARGKIIYGDSSGNPAALSVGSANQVLTSDGTDVAWAASQVEESPAFTGNVTVGGTLGVTGVTTSNAGVVVDELTIDADTITATDDFIIDAVGDITLDADGGDILFKDGGTQIANLSNSSSDFVITSLVQDKDILIKGDDGGSTITALTLDMSDAGTAKFNNHLHLAGNADIVGQIGAYDNTAASWGAMGFRATNYTFKNSGGTVKVSIDSSGNVGIGETSPLGILHVKDADSGAGTPNESANTLVLEEDDNCGLSIFSGNNDNGMIAFGDAQDADVGSITYDHNTDALNFIVNASQRHTISSTGAAKSTINSDTDYSSTGEPAGILTLYNSNGSDGGGVNNYSSLEFNTGDGATSQGFINYVRTADNQGKFTFSQRTGSSSYAEAMTILNDGKVGIGTTSPLSHLTFESDHWNTGTEDGPSIRWNNGITTADSVLQSFEDSNVVPMILGMNAYIASGGSFASFNSSYASAYVYTGADGSVYLGNAASGTPSNKVRVHPDGNTGIGGNATNAKLEVVATSGEVFRADANNGAYRIVANQDNVMLNGTVLVGTSSAVSNAKLTVDGGDMMVQGANNSAGISDLLPGYTRGDYGVIHSTANHVYFSVGSSYVSYINGGNGTFNVSDQRLKENVTTLTGALNKVKQLRGVSFTWKDTEERGTDTAIGLIAQEVEAVYPQLVDDGGLPKDNDGNDPLKSVNYAHLTSVLIEAIKELSTELDAAKARITTLEG